MRARRSVAKAAWAILCSPFGRLKHPQENVQTPRGVAYTPPASAGAAKVAPSLRYLKNFCENLKLGDPKSYGRGESGRSGTKSTGRLKPKLTETYAPHPVPHEWRRFPASPGSVPTSGECART